MLFECFRCKASGVTIEAWFRLQTVDKGSSALDPGVPRRRGAVVFGIIKGEREGCHLDSCRIVCGGADHIVRVNRLAKS